MRRLIPCLWIGLASLVSLSGDATAQSAEWSDIVAKARGQTVYFNAWGGGEQINAYIAWTAQQLDERYGIKLEHVKLADTADAVARVLAEKTAGKTDGGSVDLIWINGENFAAMKNAGLAVRAFRGIAAELPLRRCRGQADRAQRFHRAGRRAGIALGHGADRFHP